MKARVQITQGYLVENSWRWGRSWRAMFVGRNIRKLDTCSRHTIFSFSAQVSFLLWYDRSLFISPSHSNYLFFFLWSNLLAEDISTRFSTPMAKTCQQMSPTTRLQVDRVSSPCTHRYDADASTTFSLLENVRCEVLASVTCVIEAFKWLNVSFKQQSRAISMSPS